MRNAPSHTPIQSPKYLITLNTTTVVMLTFTKAELEKAFAQEVKVKSKYPEFHKLFRMLHEMVDDNIKGGVMDGQLYTVDAGEPKP